MLSQLLAAGRAVTSRVPRMAGLARRYGPTCLGVVAKLRGRCRVGGGVFTTRERFITLAAAGEMLKDTYEVNERRALEAVLDPDLPVIDCGASLGVVACLVNRRLTHPERHVAVEANPDLLPVLERHRAMNSAQFQILHAAVAYGAAQVDFNISGNSLAGSLAGRGGRRVSVPAITLREVARQCGFERFGVLCDIEGAEMDILRYDEAVLVERAQWVIMESHTGPDGRDLAREVVEWFTSRGFRHVSTGHTVHAFLGPVAGSSSQGSR